MKMFFFSLGKDKVYDGPQKFKTRYFYAKLKECYCALMAVAFFCTVKTKWLISKAIMNINDNSSSELCSYNTAILYLQ